MIFLKLRSEPVGQHGGWFLIGENFLVCIQGPVQLNLLCSLGHPTQARSEGVCRVLCAFLKCPVRSHRQPDEHGFHPTGNLRFGVTRKFPQGCTAVATEPEIQAGPCSIRPVIP